MLFCTNQTGRTFDFIESFNFFSCFFSIFFSCFFFHFLNYYLLELYKKPFLALQAQG
jgi:hypothetical protein